MGEAMQIDWDSLKPEPMPLDRIQSHQVIDCATDAQARSLVSLMKKAGKRLHPNIDRKKGIYYTFGEMAAKVDNDVRFKGYQVLPAYMFIA